MSEHLGQGMCGIHLHFRLPSLHMHHELNMRRQPRGSTQGRQAQLRCRAGRAGCKVGSRAVVLAAQSRSHATLYAAVYALANP